MTAINLFIGLVACLLTAFHVEAHELMETIDRVKPSIVVIGTYKKTQSPAFTMRGTGFVIAGENLVATNAHVLPEGNEADAPALVVLARINGNQQIRRATIVTRDSEHDLALLSVEGSALPILKLKDSDSVREGQAVGFTGFPIGGALGFSPVTHHGIISSITPIALPTGNAQQLNEKSIQRIKSGPFNIFQLDATAYPGNSGSPVFDVDTGDVIGIVNMVFIKGSKESALTHPSGISYAIPSNFLTKLLAR